MNYFLDCEFDLGDRLISIALVREDGKRMYAVTHFGRQMYEAYKGRVMRLDANFVWQHVVPFIDSVPEGKIDFHGRSMSDQMITAMLASFLREDTTSIHIIADWPIDIWYMSKLLLIEGGAGMINIPGISFVVVREDAYPTKLPGAVRHNALWDALALRSLFDEAAPAANDETGTVEI